MDLQRLIQGAADGLVARGVETGLQVAVYHRGQQVVDVVAGVADRASGRPVVPSTLFFSFSAAKGVTALLAHLLVRNGLIGYDTRVSDVWPEFRAHGKGTATLRHVLTHTVGVPAMPGTIGPADLADWSRISSAIAEAEPRWRPGTRTGYHSYTFGFLVGEIAYRLTGMPMGQLLHDWIATPIGMTDEIYFGVPQTELSRLARLEDAEPVQTDSVGPTSVLAPWEMRPRASIGSNPDLLRADIPSVGTFTARGIAAAYAAMLDGVLIPGNQLAELTAIAFEGVDQVFGTPARLALGYPLGRIEAPTDNPQTAFGWLGGGGSYACADPSTRTSFAVTKNRLTPDFTTAQHVSEIVKSEIGSPVKSQPSGR